MTRAVAGRVVGRWLVAAVAWSVLVAAGCGGGGPCDEHVDCAADEVCLFGEAPRCVPECAREDEACPSGLVCDTCATASCPLCQDCVAACVLPED